MRSSRRTDKSSRLVRLMVSNWIFGWAIGCAVAAAVLISNVGGIRVLMFHSEFMWQGLALLFGGFGFTFGSVVCATAIMLLPTEEDKDDGRGGGTGSPVLLPAYALARARSAR